MDTALLLAGMDATAVEHVTNSLFVGAALLLPLLVHRPKPPAPPAVLIVVLPVRLSPLPLPTQAVVLRPPMVGD
jgi:hypothetical protein